MLHKNVIKQSGFRTLDDSELETITGSGIIVPGQRPSYPNDFDRQDWQREAQTEAIMFILQMHEQATENGQPPEEEHGSTEGDIDINSEGNLEVTLGDGENSVTFEFDLAALYIESITVNIDNNTFIGKFDLSSQAADGTYNVDFENGLSGSLSFRFSGDEQKIEGTLTVNF